MCSVFSDEPKSPDPVYIHVCVYGGVVWYFDLCVRFVSCIVMMSGCVFLFLDFVSDTVYGDL